MEMFLVSVQCLMENVPDDDAVEGVMNKLCRSAGDGGVSECGGHESCAA